ncbi:killer cell lectin-like receptor subfamily B member 1B allele B isoform X2 [Mixophyes fleayi]|uniref:killer cell lectin-like receptor subfamily B member 1B allele B isoform X2 n=1 Tax=Mixophyes fleayi TaxID=3061075 RepID=UPI003F4D8684
MDSPDKTLQTKLWIPSWKFIIITVLIGANIIILRIIMYQDINYVNYSTEIKKQLCVSPSETQEGCILCPSNWLLYGDNCYYYSDAAQRTWNQSQDHCEMMGAHLLVIEDQEPQTDDMFWIGLYRAGDGWRWVNSRHYDTSLFQLEVNSGNCALMNKHGYYTGTCNSKNRFICQRKAVKI